MRNLLTEFSLLLSELSGCSISFLTEADIYKLSKNNRKKEISQVIQTAIRTQNPAKLDTGVNNYFFIPLLLENQGFTGCIELKGNKEIITDEQRIDTIRQLCLLFLKEVSISKNQHNTFYTSSYTFEDIISNHPLMLETIDAARRVAVTDSTILITGESGTGKELFAHAIHHSSSRKNKPFVTINCSAIPEQLLESELFGYEKGAFTGASSKGKKGKFEIANGGTIFLDEIGEMPLNMQAKLLRVLQEQKIEKIGSEKTIIVNVRIIAATNRNLYQMVKDNEFRLDLYYRLNVIPLTIPPLRKRESDIILLAQYFIKKYNDKLNCAVLGLDSEAEEVLLKYFWPGNVRELQNVIEFAMNFCREGYISLEHLPQKLKNGKRSGEKLNNLNNLNIRDWEKRLIIEALKKYGKSTEGKKKAAEALGINITTLYRKIRYYNIDGGS